MIVHPKWIPLIAKLQRTPPEKKELEAFLPEGEIGNAEDQAPPRIQKAPEPFHDQIGWWWEVLQDLTEKNQVVPFSLQGKRRTHDVDYIYIDIKVCLQFLIWHTERHTLNRSGQRAAYSAHFIPAKVQHRFVALQQERIGQRQLVPVSSSGLLVIPVIPDHAHIIARILHEVFHLSIEIVRKLSHLHSLQVRYSTT